MNAQELIDQATGLQDEEQFFELFYPQIHKQKQADKNLTKCLRELN